MLWPLRGLTTLSNLFSENALSSQLIDRTLGNILSFNLRVADCYDEVRRMQIDL